MPAVALETAKSFLGVTGNVDDAQIQLLVDAAIGEVEATTGTRLIADSVVIKAETFAELAHLSIGPVTTIVSVTYEADGGRMALPEGQAVLTGSGLDRGIVVTDAPAGSGIEATVTVGYGTGESAVPAQLRWAVLALVRGKFDDREVDIEPLIANYRMWG